VELITFEECLAPPTQNRKAVITKRGMTFECVRCGKMMPKLYIKDFRKAKGFLNQIRECSCNNRIIQGFGYSWYDYEAAQERERKFKLYMKQKYE